MKRAAVAAIAAGAAGAAAAVVLALPLFYDTVVDEPPPLPALPQALDDVRAGLTMEEFSSMPDGERAPLVVAMPDSTRSMVMDEAARSPTQASEAMPAAPGAGAGAAPSVARAGQFEGVAGHRAAGTAQLISAGGAEYLRFEDFEVTNGPDLRVYLTRGGDVGDGLHLAKLKGSRGDQNYDVTGLGAGGYDTVVVYCQPFGVHFAHAVLSDPRAAAGGGGG